MDYCGPKGLAHSRFLGGPDVWTDEDRNKALAWAHQQNCTCGTCGTRPEEWDPAKGGRRDAYEFTASICPGCEHLERTRDEMGSEDWKGQRGKQVKAVRASG